MVTQKPISLKIDTTLLKDLDAEAALGLKKRNHLINEAIRLYLELKDERRRIRLYGSIDDRKVEVNDFLRQWFPEIAIW